MNQDPQAPQRKPPEGARNNQATPGENPGQGQGNGDGPGGSGGGPGGGSRSIGPQTIPIGPQPVPVGPRIVGVGPRVRQPEIRVPTYAVPTYPVLADLRPIRPGEYRPGGPGDGSGSGGGSGDGSGGGDGERHARGPMAKMAKPQAIPQMVLYISCGEDDSPGKVYQVDDNGRVLGLVHLPKTATGLAMHRQHGLIASMPRDGGQLVRIDESGRVEPILEKDSTLVHPVDVGVPADSDTIVVADDIAHCLGATNTGGIRPQIYQKLPGDKLEQPKMSVAVTRDRHVIYGSNTQSGKPGIYRLSGDPESAARGPLLPDPGGVAADVSTIRWAAAQGHDQVFVMEGEEIVKKLKLPANKRHFRNGLLSFAPDGSVVVAARPADESEGEPWLIQYSTKDDSVRNLFPWKYDRMVDFVVGPRMYWERKDPQKPTGSLY